MQRPKIVASRLVSSSLAIIVIIALSSSRIGILAHHSDMTVRVPEKPQTTFFLSGLTILMW